jgi:hypothetical protein
MAECAGWPSQTGRHMRVRTRNARMGYCLEPGGPEATAVGSFPCSSAAETALAGRAFLDPKHASAFEFAKLAPGRSPGFRGGLCDSVAADRVE